MDTHRRGDALLGGGVVMAVVGFSDIDKLENARDMRDGRRWRVAVFEQKRLAL